MAVGRLGFTAALGCLLLLAWVPYSASEMLPGLELEIDASSTEFFSAGDRHLQQFSTPCPHQFNYDNFSILLDACPFPNETFTADEQATYPKKQCCAGLATMLCPYRDLINDQNSLCAASYWSIVAQVGNYTTQPQQFFGVICTDVQDPNGIPCPTVQADAPTPAQAPPIPGYGPTFFIMLSIFGFVIPVW